MFTDEKERMFQLRVTVIFLSILFGLLGCERHKDPWAPPSFLPRIWWGKCIDWVFLGDDEATVVRKLGQPTAISFGNGHGYHYYTGEHAGMVVGISIWTHKVYEITVRKPYSGTSKEGIGIGSPRDAVVRAIGQPDTSVVYVSRVFDYYHSYGRFAFNISYDKDNTVECIDMYDSSFRYP